MRMLAALGLALGGEQAGTVVCPWQFCDEQGEVLSDMRLEALWGHAGQGALLPEAALENYVRRRKPRVE